MPPRLKLIANLLVLIGLILCHAPANIVQATESSIRNALQAEHKTYLPQVRTINHEPNLPNTPVPAQDAADQELSVQLSWAGGDPDGDAVVYDVYLDVGNVLPATRVANHQAGTTFNPGTLAASTTYSWKVVAFDEHGLSTPGPVWRFTTRADVALPGAFEKVSPANGAVDQSTSLSLDWGDSSGAASYAYCYDTSDDHACSGWTSTGATSHASISGLSSNTTYYWQARATNSAGNTYANGSETHYWSFTTGDGGVVPGEMVSIPAGTFQMGCDPTHNGGYDCDPDELPLHTVQLDAYRIDKYEVTNGQYAQCVAAGACAAPSSSASQTRGSYYGDPAFNNYPVIFVTWDDANAYCAWAGKRLPTEAEWEMAARGTDGARAYPWGDSAPTCALANHNYYDGSSYSFCMGDTTSIGSNSAGASPYGVLNMAGNVSEWVNDWYLAAYYQDSPPINPPGPTTALYKVARGGSWFTQAFRVLTADRSYGWPDTQFNHVGFRCAAAP